MLLNDVLAVIAIVLYFVTFVRYFYLMLKADDKGFSMTTLDKILIVLFIAFYLIWGFSDYFGNTYTVHAAEYTLETSMEESSEQTLTEQPATEQPTTEVNVTVEVPTEEPGEISPTKFEYVTDDSAQSARRCQIWTFYLLLIHFVFDVIRFADSKFEKSFRRMGKD